MKNLTTKEKAVARKEWDHTIDAAFELDEEHPYLSQTAEKDDKKLTVHDVIDDLLPVEKK